MLKILISAYAVSPNHGSEPGVGWNLITQISKFCKVIVITEAEFKNDIEIAVQKLPQKDNLVFHFNDIGEKARKMCWDQGDYRFYYYYRKWQQKSLQIAKQIILENNIDIIHQLNMIGYREPGYLWKIKNIPFIWGPVGGFNFVPLTFLPSLGFKKTLFYISKNTLNIIQAYSSYRVRKAANRANLIFSASSNTKKALIKFFNKDSVLFNETGCQVNSKIEDKKHNQPKKEFNILWVGRFIPTKLLGLALQSIKKIKHLEKLNFHIVGDGINAYDLSNWQNYAFDIGVQDKCNWHGKISQFEVQQLMQSFDLLFFTSIVEGTSHVILEAISNSLPILCFDTCGHGELVTEEIGIKIPLENPNKSIARFAVEIEKLYHNRNLLLNMSNNCKLKIDELSWEEKGHKLVTYYNNLK